MMRTKYAEIHYEEDMQFSVPYMDSTEELHSNWVEEVTVVILPQEAANITQEQLKEDGLWPISPATALKIFLTNENARVVWR